MAYNITRNYWKCLLPNAKAAVSSLCLQGINGTCGMTLMPWAQNTESFERLLIPLIQYWA